jgi:transcriptional regulator with XRE-family HTH domain
MNRLRSVIQQRLDERGWTRNHLADRSGVPRQTVYKLMRAESLRALPADRTLAGLARGLDLPERMLRDAAAESIGIRIYDEPVSDPDMKVVIATMEKLTPARRRAIRKMVEAMTEDYLGGDE